MYIRFTASTGHSLAASVPAQAGNGGRTSRLHCLRMYMKGGRPCFPIRGRKRSSRAAMSSRLAAQHRNLHHLLFEFRACSKMHGPPATKMMGSPAHLEMRLHNADFASIRPLAIHIYIHLASFHPSFGSSVAKGHDWVHTLLRQRPGRLVAIRMGEYGVATNNVFALLDEENEDPQALASKAAADGEKSSAKKEAAPKAQEVPKTAGEIAWAYLALCEVSRSIRSHRNTFRPGRGLVRSAASLKNVFGTVASNVEARMRGLSTTDGPGRGRGRGPPRGGSNGRGRGGYDRPAMENDSFDAGNGPAASRGRSGRGGRDGGRGGRGGRGPREGSDGRAIRRQYDRRDGTGRG